MQTGDDTAIAFDEAMRANRRPSALGMTPTDYVPGRLGARTAVEIKHDGICLLDVDGELQTLEGVPFACASHLAAGLQRLREAFGVPMVLQGEYQEAGGFEATLSAFQRGFGAGALFLFDAVPVAAWAGAEQSAPLYSRRRMLEEAWGIVRPGGIGLVKHGFHFDAEGVELAAGEAWADGLEGVVAKDLDSPYVRGRSRFWMKVKRTLTVDAAIASVRVDACSYGEAARVPSTGRVQGIAVLWEGRHVAVPVGFSEAERAQPRLFLPGRIVEIEHKGRTPSGALKSATFRRFRDDKGG